MDTISNVLGKSENLSLLTLQIVELTRISSFGVSTSLRKGKLI